MKDLLHELKIGSVTLENNILLAPMAGVTDLPFRLLCKEQGADLICTEMVSAKGIMYNNRNTEDLLRIDDRERPVSLQLFGADPDIISEQAKRIEERNFDILDINMGCPVPKVVNNGEGSALLNNIPLAAKIIEKTVKAIDKPVTVKFRKGFRENDMQAVALAKAAAVAYGTALACGEMAEMAERLNALAGMPAARMKEVFPDKKQGYGVVNIVTRLRLKYGDEAGIWYQALEEGTACVIRVPEERTGKDEE